MLCSAPKLREVGGVGWALVSWWWAIVFFYIVKKKILDFIFLSLCLGFFLTFSPFFYLIYCIAFISPISFLPFYSFDSLPSTEGEVSEWLHGSHLLPRVKPQQWVKKTCVILQANCTLGCKGKKRLQLLIQGKWSITSTWPLLNHSQRGSPTRGAPHSFWGPSVH